MEVKMKNFSLLKTLILMLVFVGILSWIIPAGAYNQGVYNSVGTIPLGFFDLFRIPLIIPQIPQISIISNNIYYIYLGIYFLVIGGFYGVVNKTGVYNALVDFFAHTFSKKEHTMLIATSVFFGILSSFTGLTFVLFIYVPFFIAVLLEMKYSKKTAILATIGAIIVGNFASIYGFNVSGYLNLVFQLDVNNSVFIKIILFIAAMALLIVYLIKTSKDKQEEKRIDTPLYDDNKEERKSFVPLVILMDTLFAFLLVAAYNWREAFDFKLFDTLHTDMLAFELFGFPIFKNVFGVIGALGTWELPEIIIMLLVVTLLVAWLYSVKFDDMIKSFIEGAKEMLKPAFYALMTFIVTAFLIKTSESGGNIYFTLLDGVLGLKEGFSYFGTILSGVLGGLFNNDFIYFLLYNSQVITTEVTDVNKYPIIAMAYQTIHSVFMLIMPTSMLLVVGLVYLKVSFVDWIKYVWKFAALLFALALVLITLMTLLI
jgi:uncharacterized ion transporter superfamily protein YfcC